MSRAAHFFEKNGKAVGPEIQEKIKRSAQIAQNNILTSGRDSKNNGEKFINRSFKSCIRR
jgi:hypothetical protein